MHMDGNADIAGGRTWKLPRELYLLPLQDHNCQAACCLQRCRAPGQGRAPHLVLHGGARASCADVKA